MLGDTAEWAFQVFAPVSLNEFILLTIVTNVVSQKKFAAAFLTLGRPFLDINLKFDGGFSFLHFATRNVEFDKIKLLVDKGIKIDDVDDSGMTSLQSLLWDLRLSYTWRDEFESIKYLIRHGANIHAIYEGKSCSAIVYRDGGYGSYAGDVWDAALADTGHNVQEFRASYPHRSHYYGKYTVGIFKSLWNGIEDRCPYYAEATRDNADNSSEDYPDGNNIRTGKESMSSGVIDPSYQNDSSDGRRNR